MSGQLLDIKQREAMVREDPPHGLWGILNFAASLDISADLPQIARTRALVVSSGVKSILDVPATAELLETLGLTDRLRRARKPSG